MIFSPGAITIFFHRYLFHFAVGEGGGGSLYPSDDDVTLPLPAPLHRASAPMTQITVKSEPKPFPPSEVHVKLLDGPPLDVPGQPVTPPPAAPPARVSTRSKRNDNAIDIDEEAGKAARRVFDLVLSIEKGWFHGNGDSLHDFAFFPGSLWGIKDIKKKGVRGVHYAIGELELCKMLQTYGLDHAPKNLEDIPAEPDRYSNIYELKKRVEDYLKEMQEKRQPEEKKEKSPNGTPIKRKRDSRSDNAAKKSKPAAGSQTSKDIAERDGKILALKAELDAQKTAAASEKDTLEKKLDDKTNEVTRLKDDLAKKEKDIAERDDKTEALKAELEAQKIAAASEKDTLEKKLDDKTDEVARLEEESARMILTLNGELEALNEELKAQREAVSMRNIRMTDEIRQLRDMLAKIEYDRSQFLSTWEQVQRLVGTWEQVLTWEQVQRLVGTWEQVQRLVGSPPRYIRSQEDEAEDEASHP